MLLGVGASKKTYMDDVFSNYLYKGTGASRTINNGTNLSGEGGMVWLKGRDTAVSHVLFDTERGATKMLIANDTYDTLTISNSLTSFNSNGFTLGDYSSANGSGNDYSSWTFRKAKGFFDIVTYTGSSSARTIAHSLGCVPGAIFIKKTSSNDYWAVYHEGLDSSSPEDYYSKLNENSARIDDANFWNDTKPTASVFSLGDAGAVNSDGNTYIAYLFAGGESTAATARGVRFDGSDDYLSLGASNDFDMGTGDFTIECWINRDDTSNNSVWTLGSFQNGMELYIYNDNSIRVYGNNGSSASWLIQSSANALSPGTWHHIAVVRHSGTLKLFQNGTLLGSTAHSSAMPNNSEVSDFFIGVEVSTDGSIPGTNPYFDGEISNFRVVKGTAVYTSSFRPLTEPLTNVTNTKLLCCNNSSVTGSTVTPGTITAHSSPTASTDSPFDDPAAFKFGDSKEGIIKCDSYVGQSADFEVNVGFEPQWIMIKAADSTGDQYGNWVIFDSMRGVVTAENDTALSANRTEQEGGTYNYAADFIQFQPTGFKVKPGSSAVGTNNLKYIFTAIRRSDGYVGKPVETATSAFAMDTGNSSSTIPAFDSGYPVDFALYRKPAAAYNWWAQSRLLGGKVVKTNSTDAQTDNSSETVWDSNSGWAKGSGLDSTIQSWMWKRHAGFDVIAYKGNGIAGRQIPHSLNKTVEMMWVKTRSSSGNDAGWQVYHKGLGPVDNDAEGWNLYLNTNQAQNWNNFGRWNKTLPTSTHFTLGNYDGVNKNGDNMVALLFASVEGISKVGSYSGSSSSQTITTGFQPRFVIIKRIDAAAEWYVLDTTRGWGSGNDKVIKLNNNQTQFDHDMGAPTSTGFTLTNHDDWNNANKNYIYYCHA